MHSFRYLLDLMESFDRTRVGFKAWFHPATNVDVNLSPGSTHLDVLMRNPYRFGSTQTWDIVAALDEATDAGWVRLAVDVNTPTTIAIAQGDNEKTCLAAARWMRKQDSNAWDLLRVQTDITIEIEGSDQIDVFLKRGRMRSAVREADTMQSAAPKLYHGTCHASADALTKHGWQPGRHGAGGNMGQSRYLYLSTAPEDALWFAQEKGCDAVLELTGLPLSALIVDPEDGIYDTVEEELRAEVGKVALRTPIGPEHFKPYEGPFSL